MNASTPPAASRRSREPADAPAAEETLSAHARRVLRTRVRARVTAVLDAGIAFLQRLRTKAGGEPEKAEDPDDRRGFRPERPEARRGAAAAPAETPAEAPKPKRRRLRAFLVYVSVLLIGGAGGGALAYTLFQQQLDQLLNDSLRQEAARAKKTRPSAEIQKAFDNEQARRADAEKKLAASLAAYSAATSDAHRQLESLVGEQVAENRRLQAALADSTQSGTAARKALTEEQAKRSAAEEKLAASSTSMTEKQKQLDAAKKQLAALNVADAAPGARRDLLASRTRDDSGRSRPLKTGDCTLGAKNVDALKRCIADFNR